MKEWIANLGERLLAWIGKKYSKLGKFILGEFSQLT